MKKLFIAVLLLFPTLAFAQTFDTNLSYGSTGSDVTALQEFLTAQHVYNGPISGNFFSLTLAAVKRFQVAESISPVSGFVGPITRGTINTLLAQIAPQDEGNASTSTLPVDLSQSTTTPTYSPPQVIYVQVPAPVVTPPAVQQPVAPVIQTPPPRNPPTTTTNNSNTLQSIPPGTTDVVMDTFSLSVSPGDEGVFITSIPLALTLTNGAKVSDLNRCTLYDSSNILRNGGGNVVNGISLNGFTSGGTLLFKFTDSLTIPSGTSAYFTVRCDISPSAINGSDYIWSSLPSWSSWGSSSFGDSLTITSNGNSGESTVVATPPISCIDQQTAQLKANTPGIDASQTLYRAILACR